ncbi:hypothetical protein RN001_011515 [Aquatica leii]|uniref:Heparanase n=1 Tax=Aquatica leii TaxID=1421715 RepID=A0AAN7P478_9COLE|nr:hypothetical protein RN001_011515 [Aquatica leii]
MLTKIFFVALFLNWNSDVESKEAVFIINEKSTTTVSSEFLSFSIDLDSLLRNSNNSFSNVYVNHLTPFFVQLLDANNRIFPLSNTSLAEWKILQEWFKKHQLVPIFTIKNKNSVSKRWNPDDLIPLLQLNEKMGHSCYWQLSYDCDYKSLIKYKEDLMMLKYVLDAYSPSKLIAANLHSCRPADGNVLGNTIRNLNGIVDAYIRDSSYPNHDFIPTQTPIWMSTPKKESVSFDTTLQWARQIGEAAKNSYKVAFWNGDFNSIFSDTSVFWFSFLYKKLIGETVLDVRTNALVNNEADVTAYCAKYPKVGAIVFVILNDDIQESITSIKLESNHQEYIDVDSYVLTAPNNYTYLNGKKLSKSIFENGFDALKIQKKVEDGILHLTLPAHAIGMFVLPDAQIPACKGDTNTHAYKIEEESVEIMSKIGLSKPQRFNFDELKNTLENLNGPQKKVESVSTLNDFRRKKPKTSKKSDKTTKLEIIFAERPLKDKIESNQARHIELQLTNEEIKKILLDRAKARAAEGNIKTTDKQLEIGMTRAARRITKNNNDKQKYKRFATHPKRRSKNLRKRYRRTVKEDMLKRKNNVVNEKSLELIADLAPAKPNGKNEEEEILKSGEKYVDERVRFLKEPPCDDSALEGDFDDDIRFYTDRIKRDVGEDSKVRVLPNLRSRFTTNAKHIKKPDTRFLKEKVENRKKMNDWIRARRMKNARVKRSSDVYLPKVRDIKTVNNYVSKVVPNKPADLRSIQKKASYSVEDLDKREFLQSFLTLNRKPRNAGVEVHLIENTIDDHILNKIPKKKFYYGASVGIDSTVGTTEPDNDPSVLNLNTTEPNIDVTPEFISTSDKSFFNGIVDTVRDFIETVYDKISNYFMG